MKNLYSPARLSAKHLSIIFALFFSFSVLAGLTGCEPEDLGFQMEDTSLRTVTIGVTSESPATKAEIDDNVVFSWTNGDRIAVWSGNGTSGQYYTSDAYAGGNKYTVALSGVRSNYSVYPASIADGDNATSSSLKVNLPAEYDFRSTSADWSPLPMVAANIEGRNLEFKHLGGLLRVSVGYLPEGTSYVTVDLGKKINGSFPVHISNSGSYITADEATGGYTYTKFLVPSSGNVVLNLPVPTGTYNSVAVNAYNAAGTLLGSDTPTFSWTCNRAHGKKLTRDDFGWVYVFGTLSDGTVPYSGGDVTLASGFQSYRERGSEKEPVPYVLQYRYSKNGVEDWYDEAPDWMTGAPASSAGSVDGENLSLSVAPQVNSAEDPHHDVLAARTPKTDFDLSTVNVATGATVSRTTANCYVVQAPGTYKFPLVYGNGVKGGSPNPGAYRAKTSPTATSYRSDNGASYFLGSFKDHLDNNIYNSGDATSSPYLTTHLGKNASDFTPVLIWTDVPGLISVDATISGSGQNSYLTFSVPEKYITQGNALLAVLVDADGDGTDEIAWSWHIWVTEDNLTNNTTPIPTSSEEGANVYYFAPENIGWCEGKTETYEARQCQIRIRQSGTTDMQTVILSQTAGSITTGNNSLYYEWGRKDPIPAANGSANSRRIKSYYPSSLQYQPTTGGAEKVSLGTAIQTPYVYYHGAGSGSINRDWCSTKYNNLWNSVNNGRTESDIPVPVTKTIYDPSPTGYKLPPGNAFDGFNEESFTWVTNNGQDGRTYQSALFFPVLGYFLLRSSSPGGDLSLATPYDNRDEGYYWTSLPSGASSVSDLGGRWLTFSSSSIRINGVNTGYNRSYGSSVRPIVDN